MSNTNPTNLSASVRQRLLNLSRERREDFQYILTRYGVERLLFRLSQSDYKSKFILKGATLIRIWSGKEYRPTRDIDFLGYGEYSEEELIEIFRNICSIDVESDGLNFDLDSITIENIRADNEYAGNRIKINSTIENTRIRIQIDLAYGDAINPSVKKIKYPTLLDFSAPNIFIYPPESVVAEKLHALISLGIANTRMKDIYDILELSRIFSFNGNKIMTAIKKTFDRRKTVIPSDTPISFTKEFINAKNQNWKAFLSRSGLENDSIPFSDTINELSLFILPIFDAFSKNSNFPKKWDRNKEWH
ncbi:MAG: nucleotidyl transferase AbiEii/AbiGii toxin family protein [Planctomycetia bacterium]|nr:nucleotidyl transferase AbiEii/AbiGii toxin family protein [Planctomycetia bacterium]